MSKEQDTTINVLTEVLQNEVFPALGCTEPIGIAYASSIAAHELTQDIDEIEIVVDTGVYKNGFAVVVPNTGGERGNMIAGVLGALVKKPDLKMNVLQEVNDDMIRRAKDIINKKKAVISCDTSKANLYIDVRVRDSKDSARAVIEDGHTNLVLVEKNETPIFQENTDTHIASSKSYKDVLKNTGISEMIDMAENIEDEYDYLKRGIDMNLEISRKGLELRKIAYYLKDLIKKGSIADDVFSSSKIMIAAACDARMSGLNLPVMCSGGSGNQGIIAILLPYNVGIFFKIDEKKIVQSIALSHLVNSYVKCFTGELSPLCGCAIGAGVGAAVAIVYQQAGKDVKKITMAVNSLISDIGGMLCDGAKEGCASKAVSSTDSAIRAAYMALNNHGTTEMEGFVGATPEETIHNLGQISKTGMADADGVMLNIIQKKLNEYSL